MILQRIFWGSREVILVLRAGRVLWEIAVPLSVWGRVTGHNYAMGTGLLFPVEPVSGQGENSGWARGTGTPFPAEKLCGESLWRLSGALLLHAMTAALLRVCPVLCSESRAVGRGPRAAVGAGNAVLTRHTACRARRPGTGVMTAPARFGTAAAAEAHGPGEKRLWGSRESFSANRTAGGSLLRKYLTVLPLLWESRTQAAADTPGASRTCGAGRSCTDRNSGCRTLATRILRGSLGGVQSHGLGLLQKWAAAGAAGRPMSFARFDARQGTVYSRSLASGPVSGGNVTGKLTVHYLTVQTDGSLLLQQPYSAIQKGSTLELDMETENRYWAEPRLTNGVLRLAFAAAADNENTVLEVS